MATSDNREELLDLDPDNELKGDLKTDQPELLQSRENSGFEIAIRREHEIHGFWEGPSSGHASLIVLRFHLFNSNRNRSSRFKSFQPVLRFESNPKGDPAADPYIISFGPGQDGSWKVTESTAKHTESTSVQGNVSAQLPATSIGGQVSRSNTVEHDQPYYYEVSASSKRASGRSRPLPENQVEWNLQEDPNTEVGVGDIITVAVLVRRPDAANFVVHLKTKARVNSRYWLTEKSRRVKKLFLRRDEDYKEEDFDGTKYKPLYFDTSKSTSPAPKGIEANRLHDASNNNLLDQLAYLHVPEKASPRAVLQAGQPQPATIADLIKVLTLAVDPPILSQDVARLEEGSRKESEKEDEERKEGEGKKEERKKEEERKEEERKKKDARKKEEGKKEEVTVVPQHEHPDDVLSDEEDQDDVLSDDEAPHDGNNGNGNFSAAQKDYIHALLGVCSLYHHAQKELFRECNRLRRLNGIPPDKAKETKNLLADIQIRTDLAAAQLRPFARTKNLVLKQKFDVQSTSVQSSDVDKGVFPVPFAGAEEDPKE
jgi:hypothetical protein